MVRHNRHRILKTNPSAAISLGGENGLVSLRYVQEAVLTPRTSRHVTEEQIGVQPEMMEMSTLCGKEREEDTVETSADTTDSSSVGCEQRAIPTGSSWESQEARSEWEIAQSGQTMIPSLHVVRSDVSLHLRFRT